jgi:hypothetical protein
MRETARRAAFGVAARREGARRPRRPKRRRARHARAGECRGATAGRAVIATGADGAARRNEPSDISLPVFSGLPAYGTGRRSLASRGLAGALASRARRRDPVQREHGARAKMPTPSGHFLANDRAERTLNAAAVAAGLEPRPVPPRRGIHARPAAERARAAGIAAVEPARLDIPHRAGTVGTTEDGPPGPAFTIRADTDAPPIGKESAARVSAPALADADRALDPPVAGVRRRSGDAFAQKGDPVMGATESAALAPSAPLRAGPVAQTRASDSPRDADRQPDERRIGAGVQAPNRAASDMPA